MQQRSSPNSIMEIGNEESDESCTNPPSRCRLKVLGRSHAIREEHSPPREAPPLVSDTTSLKEGQQPQLLHSPPTVVLSPSPVEDEAASAGTRIVTPGSSTRCSPHHETNGLHSAEADLPPSPKYQKNMEKMQNKSSQIGSKSGKRCCCDCQNQNCTKCLKDRNAGIGNVNNNSPNMLFVNKGKGKLKQQSSSQTSISFESSTNSPCLSRDSSAEFYTDTTGVDLEQFIPDTINRNPKDRALMLRIEEELVNLANDKFQTHYKFPPMTSYHRMLVHRCAAYFGMDHNIDQSGKCIVVNKTKNTRIPEIRFKEHIKEIFNDEPPRRSILKRDSNSIEDYCFKSPDRGFGSEGRRSKSFEEREEEYERAKRRIFRKEMHDSSEDFGWSDVQWSSTDSDCSKYHRLQPPEFQNKHLRRLLKVHSEETEQSMRPCVAKSYSFGGYGGVSILTRGDSVISTHSAPGPRLLTKQDSGASSVSWRLSPSSSGYKSQSQMSESVTPSPTSTPHLSEGPHNPVVVWAVTDLDSVPKGSIIINPETGKPYKNEDGTIYYYDPGKPAAGIMSGDKRATTAPSQKTPLSSPKHEKQLPIKQKSQFTNTATSPSLPFSPPPSSTSSGIPSNRSFPCLQLVNCCENPSQSQEQPHFTTYHGTPAVDSNVTVYPQPFVVYTAAPYSVPIQQQSYDPRLDQTSIPDVSGTYYLSESGPSGYPPPSPGTYWNHYPSINYYPGNAPTPTNQRFSVQQTPAFVPTGYPASVNYMSNQQNGPNSEMVPVYHNQSVQMVYPPTQPLYPNQSLVYAPNSLYHQPTAYQGQAISFPYPHGTPTPSNVTTPTVENGFVQLTQNMQQMTLGPPPSGCTPRKNSSGFEIRRGSLTKPPPRPFLVASAQSSTGTNSPSAMITSGYCNGNPGQFKSPPPSTPPTPQYVFNHPMPPRLFRQISGEKSGTAKSSRSPTPAGDMSHFERQRFVFPPNFYPGMTMPYILQSDPRFVGRGQPTVYRQATPPTVQGRSSNAQDARSHNKNRKVNKCVTSN
ncbi:hypothetical protein ABEB36_007128 [Hypothenemus hampei]|uniref:cAMP-regulated phosphoprotein 21 n=1 Tax=Hypothenemus hampei TaxID=57062 RepID=A0ABD1ESW4_HYPHA